MATSSRPSPSTSPTGLVLYPAWSSLSTPSEPKKQNMLKRKLSKEEAKGEMKKTNLIINRSEEFTFYYKPGSDGVAALLGVRMLATLFGLQFKFVPANSCNDKRCLSAPAVKYKNNWQIFASS